tara:strand:- start:119 stop:616 length:498 start_codon:yes stop_codon:yes gene_type:complete
MSTTRLSNALSPIPAASRGKSLKYRPVLTATQIEFILTMAKLEHPISELSFSIIRTLAPFQAKIQNNSITPAYSTAVGTTKDNLMDSLGGTESLESLDSSSPYNPSSPYNKQAYWEACYKKFTSDPIHCSLAEIEAAQEHAYINDLMTAAEIVDFEGRTNEGDSF